MNVLKSHGFQHFFNDMDRSTTTNANNSTAHHQNGIGSHQHGGSSHANHPLNSNMHGASVLTYRSNRRSVDRSDNKNQNDMILSHRHASNGLNHHGKGSSSTSNDCTNQFHKDHRTNNSHNTNSANSNNSANGASSTSGTAGTYHSTLLNGAAKLSEILFTTIFSTIKYRLIGGNGCSEPNDINLVINNHNADRIDDEPNDCSNDILMTNGMGNSVMAMPHNTSAQPHPTITTITSNLANGNILVFIRK